MNKSTLILLGLTIAILSIIGSAVTPAPWGFLFCIPAYFGGYTFSKGLLKK